MSPAFSAIREADEPQAGCVAGRVVDDHVVVARRLVVGPERLLLFALRRDIADGKVDERAERSRFGARCHDGEGLVGEPTVPANLGGEVVGIRPGVEAHGFWSEQGVEVPETQALDTVLRVTDHREGVEGDLQFHVSDASGLTRGDLLLVDRTRGVLDVRLPVTEELETVARPGAVDRDLHAVVHRLELLSDERRDRLHGRRAGDVQRTGDLLPAVTRWVRAVVSARRGHHRERERTEDQPTSRASCSYLFLPFHVVPVAGTSWRDARRGG